MARSRLTTLRVFVEEKLLIARVSLLVWTVIDFAVKAVTVWHAPLIEMLAPILISSRIFLHSIVKTAPCGVFSNFEIVPVSSINPVNIHVIYHEYKTIASIIKY